MRFSRLLGSLLVVGNERPNSTTWLIDGNNLKAQSKVPSERQILALKLKPLTEPSLRNYATNVALVFDGRRGEASSLETNISNGGGGGIFLTVVTPDFQTADDYIVKALEQDEFGPGRVHVVTADRELQQRVVATKQMNGGAVIHPVKFWRDHLPSLTAGGDKKKGKKDANNQPKA
jgi:predicted RNA-binding protein with PIN domain